MTAASKLLRDMVTAEHARIVLDLQRMGYISSAGSRLLIIAGKLLADYAGDTILAKLSSEHRRLSGTVGQRP